LPSGEDEDYWAFENIFDASVDRRDDLYPHQKLQYYQLACKGGKAEKIICGLKPTDDNYKVARELMKGVYGDKRAQVRRIHLRLANLRTVITGRQVREWRLEMDQHASSSRRWESPPTTTSGWSASWNRSSPGPPWAWS
jgi:hypothetical protein